MGRLPLPLCKICGLKIRKNSNHDHLDLLEKEDPHASRLVKKLVQSLITSYFVKDLSSKDSYSLQRRWSRNQKRITEFFTVVQSRNAGNNADSSHSAAVVQPSVSPLQGNKPSSSSIENPAPNELALHQLLQADFLDFDKLLSKDSDSFVSLSRFRCPSSSASFVFDSYFDTDEVSSSSTSLKKTLSFDSSDVNRVLDECSSLCEQLASVEDPQESQ